MKSKGPVLSYSMHSKYYKQKYIEHLKNTIGMKIKPLHNHVVIRQQDETETMYGNIIIADAGKEKPLMGEVVATGPGLVNINGTLIPNEVPVGATVVFPAFGGQRITVEGDEYIVCKEQDLLVILEK